MNCKYLKKKLNNKLECKLDKNKKMPNDCAKCTLKEYKCTPNQQTLCKKHFPDVGKVLKSPPKTGRLKSKPDYKMKQKSNKLANMERKRTSLFTDDLEHCIICGKSPVNIHEVFGGRNRLNSIKYKLVIPLCIKEHHNQIECKGIHFDKHLRDGWHIKGQIMFNEIYPDLNFKDIFKKNYLKQKKN